MKFQNLTILLTGVLSSLFLYNLVCTWKSNQIEERLRMEATVGEQFDAEIFDDLLKKERNKVAFSIPLLGERTLADINKYTIQKGQDMKGGYTCTLVIAAEDLLSLVSKYEDSEVTRVIRLLSKDGVEKGDLIERFCEYIKENYPNQDLSNWFADEYRDIFGKPITTYNLVAFLQEMINNKQDATIKVLQKRLKQADITGVSVMAKKGGGIEIHFPRKNDRIRSLLTKQGELSFCILHTDPNRIKEVLKEIIEADNSIQLQDPRFFTEEDKTKVEEVLRKKKILKRNERIFFNHAPLTIGKEQEQKEVWQWYLVAYNRRHTTKIKSAEPTLSGGKYVINLSLHPEDAGWFENLTGNNLGNFMVISIDKAVVTNARISNKISSGKCFISGGFTEKYAYDTSVLLEAGTLPCKLKMVEESNIGPSLGKAAKDAGMFAIMIALLLILLFMLTYYAQGGFIANVALLFNLIFILGTMAQFNAVLSLPGIAGIILTIGMSIDANVLIFERIREELRMGIYMKQAIENGYKKALSSIIDSNITTLLTGIILYAFGVGPIKGFAITLIIGILCSLFTAVLLSRILIKGFIRVFGENNISFSFEFGKNLLTNFNVDFINKRKLSYLVSLSIIVFGIGLISYQGVDWGIEFTGGRSYILEFEDREELDIPMVKERLQEVFGVNTSLEVTTYGNKGLKVTTNYRIKEESIKADNEVKSKLTNGLEACTHTKFVVSDSKEAILEAGEFKLIQNSKIGPSVAKDIKQSAWWAIFLALLMMMAYIFLSFRKFNLALAALIALFHDTLILLTGIAVAKLFGVSFEIDQNFISVVLTIIGYSINDTVVIFDRIREQLQISKGSTLGKVANVSINQTMSRTLITSWTTLLPVVTLYLIGGVGLRALSFSLLVGIISGTYSSIFIATPLAYDLEKISDKIRKKWNQRSKMGKRLNN